MSKREVVQCKDCKFWIYNLTEDDPDEMYLECRWGNDEIPNSDDYCSFGERKVTNGKQQEKEKR